MSVSAVAAKLLAVSRHKTVQPAKAQNIFFIPY